MAWERNSCGRWYYSRTVRVGGGKRLRQYLGSGAEAVSAAAADTLRRGERNAQVALHRHEWARVKEVDHLLIHVFKGTSLLATCALVAAGCYRQGG